MAPAFLRSLRALLMFVIVLTTLAPPRVNAQNYCGPVTLINFNGLNGQYPAAGVTFDANGNMYGTTAQGGPTFNPIGSQGIFNYGLGTIWKYSPSAGLTQLFAFSGQTSPANNGYRPETPLVIDAQGNLYGTTYYGGNDFSPNINNHFGWGTLFEYSSAGQFSVLHEFSGPEGANPVGELLDSKGNLWGTTWQGGALWNPTLGNFGLGTIFDYSSGTVTNPVLFTGANGGGNISGGMATDGQGNFYGTTYEGGSNGFGILFHYSANTGQLTTLFNFDRNPHGSLPAATLILDGNGNIYGTTYQGGSHSSASNYCCGTVWKYSLSSGTMSTLVSFDGDTIPADGMFPGGGVTLDSLGNVYGSTVQGGTFGDGIVFEYSATGILSTLVTFSGPNGWNPEGNLVFDSNGNLYGVTNQGGSSGYGTVYKLTPNSGGACGGITLTSLTLNPTTIANGGTSTGTVTLSAAAPSGGSVVGLSSNSSFIVVPGNVTVPAGATSANFPIATNGSVQSNTSVVITATLGNSTQQANLTLTPGIAVTSITLNPTSVTGGSNSTAKVTIASPAPSGGSQVLISKSQNPPCPPPLILPNSVTVPAGSTSTNFTVGTTTVTSSCAAQIFAQSGGATVSATLTVNPGGASGPTVSSVTLNPSTVQGGSNSQGTVTLSSVAPSGGTVVSLSSNNFSATVPGSVTVSGGSTSASFTVTTTSVTATTTAVITATLGSSSHNASLTITPAGTVTLSSLTLNSTHLSGGNSTTASVRLTAAAPSGGATVTLRSSNTSVATVPSSVTVQAGRTSASFTVSTQRVSSTTNVTISATYNGTTSRTTLTVSASSN